MLAVALHAGLVARKRNEGDLRVYYDVVARLPSGLDLYQHREGPDPDRPTGYIYPLPFALAFAPLARLPFDVLRPLWAFLTGLAALRVLALAVRLAFPDGAAAWVRAGPAPSARAAALALGALVPLRFALSDVQHGQVNSLVAWLALEGVALAERTRRDAAAGAFLAAAAAIKLTPGLLVLGYALERRWRLVAWAAGAGLGAALALPALVLGPGAALDATWRFVTEVTPWNARFHAFVGNNAALPGLVVRLLVGEADAGQAPRPMLLALDPGLGRALASAVGAGALALSFVVAARLRGVARPAFLFAAIPLISPIAWKPHLVALALPALVGARAALEAPRRGPRVALALAAACLLGGREVLGRDLADAATRWGAPTLGVVLLAAGLALAPPRAPAEAAPAAATPE